MTPSLRRIRADNPGPFTFDGTVTYLLGIDDVVVLDPGPDVDDHVRALVHAVAGAHEVTIVLTHGHGDHADAVDPLLRALASVGPPPQVVGTGHPLARPAPDGGVRFDGGVVHPILTPGHTRDHLCWYWPGGRALFAGDHILGHGDTTWVAEYPGCVADYLDSLARLRTLDLGVIHPGHGPSLTDPANALDRFERHRRARIEQVRTVRRAEPGISGDALYRAVYGDRVPPGLEAPARTALAALEEFVDTAGEDDLLSGV